ncbi:MAG: DUF2188 domain-containing protein [Phycisphaerales bacterium]
MKNYLCYSISIDKKSPQTSHTINCSDRRILYCDCPLSVHIENDSNTENLQIEYGFSNNRFETIKGNKWKADCDLLNGFVYEINIAEKEQLVEIKKAIESRIKTKRGLINFNFALNIVRIIIDKSFKEISQFGKIQHVVKTEIGWGVKVAGKDGLVSEHETQEQAINAAISNAKNQKTEVIIHGKDGQIKERVHYGNNPFHTKVRKY